jgi:hypothetical protein
MANIPFVDDRQVTMLRGGAAIDGPLTGSVWNSVDIDVRNFRDIEFGFRFNKGLDTVPMINIRLTYKIEPIEVIPGSMHTTAHYPFDRITRVYGDPATTAVEASDGTIDWDVSAVSNAMLMLHVPAFGNFMKFQALVYSGGIYPVYAPDPSDPNEFGVLYIRKAK